jgi:hypothetical protein
MNKNLKDKSVERITNLQNKMSQTFQEINESLKEMSKDDLFRVLEASMGLLKKSLKGAKGKKEPKKGSMPKGEVPPQLMKPRAWVDFTLKGAQENGWEAFQVRTQKKDKVTGEVTEQITEMPESEEHNGTHIFKGSVSEKTPNGKQLIHKDAMSLSKQRWAPKEQKGTHKALYEEFEAAYVAPNAEKEEEEEQVKVAPVKVELPKAAEPPKKVTKSNKK